MPLRRSRRKHAPVRRWYKRGKFRLDAQGFSDPREVEKLTRKLITRLTSTHSKLKGRGGLWGARFWYFEEVDTTAKGKPKWGREIQSYNVTLGGRSELIRKLRLQTKYSKFTLTNQTHRRSMRSVEIYVYPDQSLKSKRREEEEAERDMSTLKKKIGHRRRDKFGRFWNGESAPKARERDAKGRFKKKT